MTSLCIDCGLCCDGTMYSTVEINEADRQARLQKKGFNLLLQDGKSVFEQPCTAFGSGCCSIYAQRPAMCRAYRCALLRKHDANEISTHDAKALIAGTIAARDRVRPALEQLTGAESSLSLPKLLKLMEDVLASMDIATRRRDHGELLLDVGVLRVLLMQHFEPRDTKLEKSPIDGDAPSGT